MNVNLKFLSKPFFQDINNLTVLSYLFRESVIQNRDIDYLLHGRQEKIKPGQVMVDVLKVAHDLNMPDEKVDIIFSTLEKMKIISELNSWSLDDGMPLIKYSIDGKVKKSKTVTPHEQFPLFIEAFKAISGKKHLVGDYKSICNFNKAIEAFSIEQIVYCIKRIYEDSWHQSIDYKPVTPEYVTRLSILNKFVNVQPKKIAPKDDSINSIMSAN